MATRNTASDVATKESWPDLQPLPRAHARIPVNISLNAEQAQRVKQGFIPAIMEEKWFAYFENNTLYQHRSWTGLCIDVVPFKNGGEGGLVADVAYVNRDPSQYTETDDAADVERIESMVRDLGNRPPGATSTAVDPMVAAFEQAVQPNYLGSPEVIRRILTEYVRSHIVFWRASSTSQNCARANAPHQRIHDRTREILSGVAPDYVTLPWFSVDQLGQNLSHVFGQVSAEAPTTKLEEIVSGFLMLFDGEITDYLLDQSVDTDDQLLIDAFEPHIGFCTAALLGTNEIHYPGLTWHEFIVHGASDARTAQR